MTNLHNKEEAIEFYEDRYEHGYMEEWDNLKKEKVKEVLKSLDLPQVGKALDFGCGNGVFTRIIKDVLPEWEVYGVEISQVAVRNASVRNPGCIFFPAEQGKYFERKFDFLFSHHVIEHVQDIDETFAVINGYMKDSSTQLHILPCGNPGSYEFDITLLHKEGIEKNKGNRFFYEEPGHLRRLTTKEFNLLEEKSGFQLIDEFYSNQKDGAINWITKSSPRFVKKITNPSTGKNEVSKATLVSLRKKLLPLTYLQFVHTKYLEIKTKWRKKTKDYFLLAILFIPSLFSRIIYRHWDLKAADEWERLKKDQKGSEMFLVYKR
jgi:SAM-dependent methyltransferase